MALQRLKDAAENAKKELSSATSTEINLPFISMGAAGPIHLVKSLTRAKFESMIDFMIKEIKTHLDVVLKEADLTKSDIKEIIMVGGTTRIPRINDITKEYFGGKELNKGVNPDEVVAAGAAVQGGVLKGDVKDVLLLDVTPLSLGIETLGGVMTKLIEKGTTIPVRKSQTFSTAADNQPAVSIHVVQGEREFAKDNKSLGMFELSDISPAPRGVPQIEVEFNIDANGVLSVTAKDNATGKANNITITGSSGLSDEEIAKMVADAEANKAQDEERKKVVEARNKLDGIIAHANKTISENTSADASELKTAIEKAEEALKNSSDDIIKLEAAEQDVIKALQVFTIAAQESQTVKGHTESQKVQDDVIDAEVE